MRLDHAILAVPSLDAAERDIAPLGFRFKGGRVHPDSVANRHIKFGDGSGIELMTVVGQPGSALARDYATLLGAGEGGAYAALWADDTAQVERAAAGIGTVRITRSGPWRFLTITGPPGLGGVFVGSGAASAADPDSVLAHENGADGLRAAWVEGGPSLGAFLNRLGARPCGEARLPDGTRGSRWGLRRGSIVVVPSDADGLDRLLAVEISTWGRAPGQARRIAGVWFLID
ncbi:MAG: VOC family protein [Gemmatimonadales bacterium]